MSLERQAPLFNAEVMSDILVINPNSSHACTAGIEAAIAPLHIPGVRVVSLPGGPPAILTWRDWFSVAEPLCRLVEATPAGAYVIACASDPGVAAIRTATTRPVLGIFACAIAAAITRAERFGVVAIVDASKPRHMQVLRAMGLEARLAAEVAMNVSMDTLLDPAAARAGLVRAARDCVAAGAGAVILGCTGMAAHQAAMEQAAGVPVIEPAQAGVAAALLALAGVSR